MVAKQFLNKNKNKNKKEELPFATPPIIRVHLLKFNLSR
jgi:hypothetical protein